MTVIRNISVVLLVSVAVVMFGRSIVACGPDLPDEVPDDAAERYANAMCGAYERCSCIGEGVEDVDSCRRRAEDLFHEVERTPHVVFDLECFDRFIEHVEGYGCHGIYESMPSDAFPCMPFRGTLARGAACESDPYDQGLGFINTGSCAGDQPCLGGRCGGPAREVALGERCGYELGVRCGQGLYCARDGMCDEEVELGGACDSLAACAMVGSNYCAGVRPDSSDLGVCVSRRAKGETCDLQDLGACVPESSCDGGGVCGDAWPSICHALIPREVYDPREWVPAD